MASLSEESKPSDWKSRLGFCTQLPKCELHAHLNGSVRGSTLRELAERFKGEDPSTYEEVKRITDRGDRDLKMCFKLFDVIHKVTTDHDIVTRITTEVIQDFALENVRYLELRTTPKVNASIRMSKKSYVEAVLKGIENSFLLDINEWNNTKETENEFEKQPTDGIFGNGVPKVENLSIMSDDLIHHLNDQKPTRSKLKIIVRLILSIDRRESTESALETVRLACSFKDKGVVGIDLSGNPSVGNWNTFLPALSLAKKNGLAVTLHCGEIPNAEEVRNMLEFRPQRLGHICFLEDSEWKKILNLNIPVELCLTSNVLTNSVASYHDHHFSQLYSENHPFAICTDDSGVFDTSLSKEYAFLAAAFDLNEEDLFRISKNSVDHLFESPQIKRILKSEFDSFASA